MDLKEKLPGDARGNAFDYVVPDTLNTLYTDQVGCATRAQHDPSQLSFSLRRQRLAHTGARGPPCQGTALTAGVTHEVRDTDATTQTAHSTAEVGVSTDGSGGTCNAATMTVVDRREQGTLTEGGDEGITPSLWKMGGDGYSPALRRLELKALADKMPPRGG